jgi:thiol-disulfide isomerase/thioredoxin
MKKTYLVLMLAAALFAALSASAQKTNDAAAVRLEGQVVCCAECWAEKDRLKDEYGTAEDLLAAKGCVEGGDPTLLAVRTGDKFTLYQLEEGKYKRPGENWLAFVGKRVAVTGTTRREKKTHIVRVDELEITAESLATREAEAALGQTVELKLNDLFGTEQSLSQYKGRIVILNFWATYCVPCREEMPDLAEIQNEFAALGVQVIGASADEAGDRAKVLQFIKETKINFPVWVGAKASDMMRFGLGEALPGTVVLDKDGRIVKVISGVVDPLELRKQIETMLATAEASVPPGETVAEKKKAGKREESKASSVPS